MSRMVLIVIVVIVFVQCSYACDDNDDDDDGNHDIDSHDDILELWVVVPNNGSLWLYKVVKPWLHGCCSFVLFPEYTSQIWEQ